jgi:hypothetical protein
MSTPPRHSLVASSSLNFVIRLEREQDGYALLPTPLPLGYDGSHYGWEQEQHWTGTRFEPWRGKLPADWHLKCNPSMRHEKCMHIADRLKRAFPGVLISESDHAMAVYRRVSAMELILDNWEA